MIKTFKESIIDIPRISYAPKVFDNANTKNPKIKPSVIKMIEDQLVEFEKEYPVLKYTLIGSILTKRYRDDADLDINVLFDVPEDKREDERLRLSKKFLSVANPDNIQGKLIQVLNTLLTIILLQIRKLTKTRIKRQTQYLILKETYLLKDQKILPLIWIYISMTLIKKYKR